MQTNDEIIKRIDKIEENFNSLIEMLNSCDLKMNSDFSDLEIYQEEEEGQEYSGQEGSKQDIDDSL